MDKRSGTRILDAWKEALAVQIRLDIAQAIRHHPHLDGERSQEAFRTLASPDSVDAMIQDLAREEVETAIGRGEVPPAAILHLAGFNQNPVGEG